MNQYQVSCTKQAKYNKHNSHRVQNTDPPPKPCASYHSPPPAGPSTPKASRRSLRRDPHSSSCREIGRWGDDGSGWIQRWHLFPVG
jgi:hypothetical protein